jgi:hypothetical protein
MEAQSVLRKLGFESFPISVMQTGRRIFTAIDGGDHDEPTPEIEARVATLEAALATAQEAIGGLAVRVHALEGTA